MQNSLQVSPLNVRWEIDVKPNDKPIPQYHAIFSSKYTDRTPKVTASATLFNGTIINANVTPIEDTEILNHYRLTFGSVKVGESQMVLNVNLDDYYTFLWDKYETFLFNPYVWGKSIDKISITVIFLDERIENTDISLYAVDQNSFSRELLQCHKCDKTTNEYVFNYKDDRNMQNGKSFLIVIPSHKNN